MNIRLSDRADEDTNIAAQDDIKLLPDGIDGEDCLTNVKVLMLHIFTTFFM